MSTTDEDQCTVLLRLECDLCGQTADLPADLRLAVDAGWRADGGNVICCPACSAADDQTERQVDDAITTRVLGGDA